MGTLVAPDTKSARRKAMQTGLTVIKLKTAGGNENQVGSKNKKQNKKRIPEE